MAPLNLPHTDVSLLHLYFSRSKDSTKVFNDPETDTCAMADILF